MFHVNNLPHVERPATLVTANPSEQFTSSFEKVSSLVDSRCRIIFLFSGVSLIFLLLLLKTVLLFLVIWNLSVFILSHFKQIEKDSAKCSKVFTRVNSLVIQAKRLKLLLSQNSFLNLNWLQGKWITDVGNVFVQIIVNEFKLVQLLLLFFYISGLTEGFFHFQR